MTVDVAESLCVSWLRHVKGCQIVETNWTISRNWDINNLKDLEKLRDSLMNADDEIKKVFTNKGDSKISIESFFKSAETDVIGFKFDKHTIKECYGIDIAFHKDGLGYKDNIKKVLEKCIRTVMLLYSYLEITNATIIFATPKLRPSDEKKGISKKIHGLLDKLQNELRENEHFKNFTIKFIQEKDFVNQILGPVIMISDEINDQFELFARSMQLQHFLYFKSEDKNEYDKLQLKISIKNMVYNEEIKIGTIARNFIKKILDTTSISNQDLNEYKNGSVFKLGFPLLISEEDYKSDGFKDRNRYWTDQISIKIEGKKAKEKYYLCSQWKKNHTHKKLLIEWILKQLDANPKLMDKLTKLVKEIITNV